MGLPTVQLQCSRKQDLYFHSRCALFEILRIAASAAANNQGIAEARGAWIALLNNDAEARPEWLATMFRAIEQRPDYGMVACKILVYEDPHKIDKAGHLIYLDGQNRGPWLRSDRPRAIRPGRRRPLARRLRGDVSRSDAEGDWRLSTKISSPMAMTPNSECERGSPDGNVFTFLIRSSCIGADRRSAYFPAAVSN